MAGRLSKEDINREFPEIFKVLSERLYDVLESIGVATDVRDLRVKSSTTDEIIRSLRFMNTSPVYICGSTYEGTKTLGLSSDYDIVMVNENFPVVTSTSEAQQYQICLLPIQDSYTPPGYAKLHQVYLGSPLYKPLIPFFTDVDLEGRSVFRLPVNLIRPNAVVHGPAQTTGRTKFTTAQDAVTAVRCHTWPDCASEWLTRKRHNNWPTQEQLDKCKTLGCFFVPVGHPTSVENHLQWRLSFTLQERILVTYFNSVQLKCYVLLKIMKKEIIQKFIGEESLSSYHFKTCMLFMIETTPAELWKVENLLVCLHKCLARMLTYVEKRECPNYFIPEENMFEGRIYGQTQAKLCEMLRRLLSADFKYLLGITCDVLGIRYKIAILSPRTTYSTFKPWEIYCNIAHLIYLRNGSFESNRIFRATCTRLYRQKLRLQRTERVSEHTVDETRKAVSLFLPFVDISLMSVLVVKAKRLQKSNEFLFKLLTSDKWHKISLVSDSFSAKLKQAYSMTVLGYCEMSLGILSHLQDQLEDKISVCGCICNTNIFASEDVEAMSVARTSSFEELLHRYWVPCVVFLPEERELAPPALCYEMDRSVDSPSEEKQQWYDWAVVDGKILLYFLLYLNHRQRGMQAHAAADADNILWLIRTERLLGHRETALNLLGWINKERGLVDQAVLRFRQSLELKPTHNAASLHLEDINTMQNQ